MIVGYTRVSTLDQDLGSQEDALRAAGADTIFSDKSTGKNTAGPGLRRCLEHLRADDVLLVYSTDRLGRSMTDVVNIVTELQEREIQFRSLTEPFDTTTASGELFFQICAAFAQMNGRIISDRTRAGLAAARDRGRRGGRPTVMTPERIAIARRMRADKETWQTVATTLGVGMSSVRRALSEDDAHDVEDLTPVAQAS